MASTEGEQEHSATFDIPDATSAVPTPANDTTMEQKPQPDGKAPQARISGKVERMEVVEHPEPVGPESEGLQEPAADADIEAEQVSIITHERSSKSMPHDSMVTVRLSEPLPNLTVKTDLPHSVAAGSRNSVTESEDGDETPSADLLVEETEEDEDEESPRITMRDPNGNEVPSSTASAYDGSRRGSDSTEVSGEEVNWEELEKTEEQEPRDQGSDDSTALLLARLEQENNLLATNPKSGIAKVKVDEKRTKNQSRPPSMQQLKNMVNGPTPPALRYSLIPAPPMTDLEFYAALVQDYNRTAQCLPTLLSKKIRSGIPPPLRGVVWQSMSGARDRLLEDQFDRLCGESSPYEGIIGKDLGRSFPGVEMFRDPEGDGQRMLGRVLKCFSLYDLKIGYCQGLGFLVGPLLMHMGDKQAFCVLVRLMEHYDLRNCFLPDLSGLHVRIHQFRELLKQHIPDLSQHLEVLQIEPQYVSQWFLSFFAVTCPLPMLFRIYDVIFAEGASETIMRVALSLMQKNKEKILACTEFEDVMQLLLSRGLWDCYHYNADELVDDFVSLTGVVTHESLKALELSFKESSKLDTVIPSENIGSAASRFLGRLWAGSNNSTRNLSPHISGTSRPVSFLRRSPSKQSIASTLNSTEGGGSDSIMSNSTDATTVSRDSSNTDSSSLRTQSVSLEKAISIPVKSNKDKDLHGQIEDLLTALSEMQRDHAVLATQLQREREEREEDRQAVWSLLDGLRKKTNNETVHSSGSDGSLETVIPVSEESKVDTEIAQPILTVEMVEESLDQPKQITEEELSRRLDVLEHRFQRTNNRRSSMLQSKSQLRDELARSKEQLINEVSKSQDLSRQLLEQTQELQNLRDQVKDGHSHIRTAHTEKQRLEKQIYDLKARKSTITTPEEVRENQSEWPARTSGHGGLRELRLGRNNSTRTQTTTFNKRTSSLNMAAINLKENEIPNATPPPASPTKESVDTDALVLELVQAKTAEAVAKQEAEEAKAKLESLRKMLGMSSGDSPGATGHGHRASPSLPPSMLERSVTTAFGGRQPPTVVTPPAVAPPAAASVGGFWGGWGKRVVSNAATDARS